MRNTATDVWSQCIELIRNNVNEKTFFTWFEPVVPVEVAGNTLRLQVPSQFFYDYLEDHYSDLLNRTVKQVLGDEAHIAYSVLPEEQQQPLEFRPIQRQRKSNGSLLENSHLSERYTFDNFVEGSGNQFARAAALAVAEAPGKTSFNPLVIYGGVGLGKTHLIQAIGNYALKNGNVKKAIYVSSEKFTIEFINSIQKNKTTEFSNIYRSVDLLLVDDIQFFTNKERTQEEFFHTFNTLHQNGKQIVLSSDRPPHQITGIEERLLSRFQWGLVADIQPPDFETRVAILQKKAEENCIELPGDVVQLIAYNVTSNIRELEGCLIRLLAFASLKGKDINLQLAKEVLKDVISQKQKHITIEEIQKIVSDYYHIPDDLLRAKTRKKEIAIARQIAMFLAKRHTKHSLKTIGLHFGGRDHSTVIHAVNAIESLMQSDKEIREDIENISKQIEISSI
ncbi:MAG: chromosomal replication initiator protein DnaA [Calditrichaeota bacterium]|nr:MAG: chromosomal replication initiator protein DnaA [Calditrichota bacterium]